MSHRRKTALVLGSVKGIGKAIALALAREKIQVVATWFDWPEFLPDLKKELAAIDTPSLIANVNLLDVQAIKQLIGDIQTQFGGMDILINNIERGGWPLVHGEYDQEQWDLEVATTIRSKRWVFHESLPLLKASGDGIVINISSIAGLVGRAGPAALFFPDAYSAVNRGISLLTETWAREGAPEVRVNELMIGFFETRHGPQTRGWHHLTDSQKQALLNHTPLRRLGQFSDIVETILFLIKQARFMTGSVIRLDGGYILGGEQVPTMTKGIL
ncbi:MAG: 3-Oxoacyl (Acyl-carrier protein) reductase [Candidatus Magnetoglobus multicellularis str. Araruama]|uniref:3-Oxoacyl (Acyl-carrier protein) reductase n=1 Tax=Candidatus Magnetoglobus multicellularis str. Araruama TaxID=890399 RepID=A0A1V1PGA9_9BACT|nr:MAG: 3-Oxoacyl (Acyl-carrier protein) reductase [Candidatus Magnetoglobus multicellularis str. Araruama]